MCFLVLEPSLSLSVRLLPHTELKLAPNLLLHQLCLPLLRSDWSPKGHSNRIVDAHWLSVIGGCYVSVSDAGRTCGGSFNRAVLAEYNFPGKFSVVLLRQFLYQLKYHSLYKITQIYVTFYLRYNYINTRAVNKQ